MDSDVESVFEMSDGSDFSPEKTVPKAVAKKAAAKPTAPKKLLQTTLKTKPATKKRAKPDSDDDEPEAEGDSGFSNTPPKAKKPKAAPAPKKSAGKPLAEIENDSMMIDEPVPSTKPKSKKTATEEYQKLTQLEHIIKRPDTYIGSVEKTDQQMWVYNKETKQMEYRQITYVPGLYKIFDEILVNAADNKQRDNVDHTMTYLKVSVDRTTGEIIVENNGKGIPIEMHEKEKIYIPELVFGHLLSGSNYDDEEKRTVGGRNGYGAKLCNVFSTEFSVECQDSGNAKRFKQTWTENMSKMGKHKVTTSKTNDFVRISFKPDYNRFGMPEGIDEDFECLLHRRVYDLAGTTRGVKVYLNGEQIKLSFKPYCEMYAKAIAAGRTAEEGGQPTCTVEIDPRQKGHERWEVGFAVSDGSFQQVSFVNSIATTVGGTHVNYIADQITGAILTHLNKKKKGHALKQNHIRNYIFVFVNCLIDNPAFTSQTKEQMTTKVSQFGSKCVLSEEFLKKVVKSEAIQNIMDFAEKKADKLMAKSDGNKRSRVSNSKLVDANLAGTRHGHECTLILTEGDSAKSLAVAGRAVLDPDRIGVFPLRGKLLNVRDAGVDQVSKNAEIQNIKQFLGLKHKTVYTDTKSLRYGHLMIMADQDYDGSHIKGLLINFLQVQYPSLLQIPDFFREFITPIVKVWQGSDPKKPLRPKSFFTQPQYEAWKDANKPQLSRWHYKYYKGLGTSSNEDAQIYFTNLDDHLKEFEVMKPQEAELFDLAFSKKKADARKEWLGNFVPGTYLDHSSKSITYTDFVNKELILFSMADNMRSIPSVLDGFKPGQRKVIYACFKRNLVKDKKVIELAGYVSEQTAYHHGEASLQQTIIGLAQDFIGSNNVNCLEPSGNFGSRLAGGSDAASPRYIHTRLSPFARKVFSPLDEPNLEPQSEDGKSIEPKNYAPIIPMVLVNGADGIGTGWSTSIPNYNPIDIVNNIKRRMGRLEGGDGEEGAFEPMMPWFRGWKGVSEPAGPDRYKFNGIIYQDDKNPNTIMVTELPIRMWTEDFKARLEDFIKSEKGPVFVKDYKEFNDHNNVHFEIQVEEKHMKDVLAEGLHERFKLNKQVATSNMVAFDTNGRIRKYEKVEDILEEYYVYRMAMYLERKKHWLSVYHADYRKLKNQARFVKEIIDGKLVVGKKKKAILIDELRDRQYEPFPKGKDAKKVKTTDEELDASDDEEETAGDRDYDYLLSMPIWSLTQERLDRLNELIKKKKAEHDALEVLSEKDLWCHDLDEFVEEWENQLRLDAEIKTNIRRMGRRVSKKIGAGKGRRVRDEDAYEPEKKTKGGKAKAAAPKVETKTHQRFAEMFTAKQKVKEAESDDAAGNDGFSDDDFAALGRKAQPAKTAAPTDATEHVMARNKRAAASKSKAWILSDDDDDDDDMSMTESKMLGDVGAMVKGIGQSQDERANNRLSLFAMSRGPESQSTSAAANGTQKIRPKPSRTFDFDSHDDTNYEMLARSSPHKTVTKAEELDSFMSDDAFPAPKVPSAIAAKSSALASSTTKASLGVVAAKKRGRPAGSKNKDEAPAAKPKSKTAAAKPSTLSPAAKAYLAKKGFKKGVYSDDEDDDVVEAPPPRAASSRPGRTAAAKKPIILDDEDESMLDQTDPFSMDDSD